ncbi:MAG: hypothetical protein GY836_13050 [Herbaspirillum sp.]|nr:hypothetical protein [Herbaspirillum sp.]MCP4556342.1 hypothetical protein [Herbaspirillum sp.]
MRRRVIFVVLLGLAGILAITGSLPPVLAPEPAAVLAIGPFIGPGLA